MQCILLISDTQRVTKNVNMKTEIMHRPTKYYKKTHLYHIVFLNLLI